MARATGIHPQKLKIERQRLAGRSSMYVVRGPDAAGQPTRWIVKQPHTEWSQDDVGSPLTAHDEFIALQRLDAYFKRLDVPFRVPAPVAFLPEIEALAMEYVTGRTIKELLGYGSVRDPRTLLTGLTEAGAFLRCLHAFEALPPTEVDLEDEARKVIAVEEEKLRPLGLSLPDGVRLALAEVPARRLSVAQVRLHGDFGPSNILLAADGSTVGLDAAFHAIGQPEDDLVRFTALVSGVIRLAPEIVAPPVGVVRRRLEQQLLGTYYGASTWPPLFELRYLHQLARRWCRLRELAQRHGKRSLVRPRLRVVGWQMRMLMEDAGHRLVHSLGG